MKSFNIYLAFLFLILISKINSNSLNNSLNNENTISSLKSSKNVKSSALKSSSSQKQILNLRFYSEKNNSSPEKNIANEKDKKEDKEKKKKDKKEKKKNKKKEDDKENKDKDIEKKKGKEKDKKKTETPELKKENESNLRSEVILYGFELYHFYELKNIITFNVLFLPVYRTIEAYKLKLNLKINYNSSVGFIEEKIQEAECEKDVYFKNILVKYDCEFYPEKKEIESIELDEEGFEFEGQEVNIKASTPKAVKDMKNLKIVGYEEFSDKKFFVLKSSKIEQDKKFINIIGKINDENFSGENLVLSILSSDKKKEDQVNCNILKKKTKYILSCEPKNDIEGELNGAIGKFGDNNLIINFKKEEDSSIKFKPEVNEIVQGIESSPSQDSKTLKESYGNNLEDSGIFNIQLLINFIMGIICIISLFFIYIMFCKHKTSIPEEKEPEESISISDINTNNSCVEIK